MKTPCHKYKTKPIGSAFVLRKLDDLAMTACLINRERSGNITVKIAKWGLVLQGKQGSVTESISKTLTDKQVITGGSWRRVSRKHSEMRTYCNWW
jgi:hypothetical protein